TFRHISSITCTLRGPPSIAGIVDVGPGFTIDAQVDINGSPQYIKYKVQNWKGSTFHITVSNAYVNVN
ncbi:hypothetical protein V7649_21690, partial [Bacillus toyonensis]